MWAGGLSIFLLSLIVLIRVLGDRLYQYPVNPDLKDLPRDAANVCLAGGKFRVEAAYSLYANGVGDRMMIVGAGKKSTPQLLGRAHADGATQSISQERFSRIQVETESRNTIENAFAVARFMEQNPQVKTIVLVTSGYHMRRAQMMIQTQVHREIKLIPYTPPSDALNQGNWWHTWLGIEVTTVEYVKFLLASLLIPRLGYF
jgi:uncharacterized SAM-binding protein YcdF (DUF218 family)